MDPEIEDTTDAPLSLRDQLDQAFEADAEPVIAEPVTTAPEGEETQEQAAQRARDEAGRFAKEKAAKAVKPAAKTVVATGAPAKPAAPLKPGAAVVAKPGAVVAPVPTSALPVEMKAPQSWKEGAKAAWAQVPEAARLEVLRREKEIATQLTGVAEERKYATTMKQAFAPFEAQIRAEGSTPEAAIGKLMNTAMALRTAPPAHKAKLVAAMITDFGVPLEHLVAALSGQPQGQPAGQQHQAQPVDPAAIVAQVEKQLMERLGAQRDSSLVARAESELATFLDGKVMHGPDEQDHSDEIRQDMADIIERKAARGLKISLEDAYSLAAREHPEVSKVLKQKEGAAVAAKAQASTQRARAAAVSVRNQPATQPVAKGDGLSLRDTLNAAFEVGSER